MGELTGKPESSTLHIHPVLNSTSEFGVQDAQISKISSVMRKTVFSKVHAGKNGRRYDAAQWHSDIQFEPCPADYTSLRLTQLPQNGGDTLWASGYGEDAIRASRSLQLIFHLQKSTTASHLTIRDSLKV